DHADVDSPRNPTQPGEGPSFGSHPSACTAIRGRSRRSGRDVQSSISPQPVLSTDETPGHHAVLEDTRRHRKRAGQSAFVEPIEQISGPNAKRPKHFHADCYD